MKTVARPKPCAQGFQTLSFSSTGSTETTCRLNLSSESVSPAAATDQLREVEDRHLEVLPRLLLQLRLPGVEREVTERARTIASAASFACSIGWISSPRAVSSRAWMIGKPQHLILAG